MGQAADQLSATPVSPYGAASPPPAGGAPSAEELRAQIERQRAELGRDLEVLGDKVSPGRMVERRKASFRQSLHGMRERVMGVAETVESRASDTAGSLSDTVSGIDDSVGEVVHRAPDAMKRSTEGNPLAVGLMAFGAGAVLAAVLPTSERERRLGEEKATPALQRAAEEARSVAEHAVDELRPKAEEAVQEVRSSAEHAADEVKGTAQGAADEVKSDAREAAEQTTTTARS